MRTRLLLSTSALGAFLLLSGCDYLSDKSPPKIPFAPTADDFHTKMDLAQIEYKYPLTPADLQKITPNNLGQLNQEQLDQLYARLAAGPIPDGPFDGKILLARGTSGKFRFAELLGRNDSTAKPENLTVAQKLKAVAHDPAGFALQLKGLELQGVGEQLWHGKVFYRDERVLRNRIEDLRILQALNLVRGEPKKVSIEGKEAWLLFPAKLYCGQSLFDSRRESVIIDYFFTDEIPGYMEYPDFLAGRRGVRVRDEIRMIRPGFYLGRAYLDRVFGVNFTLYNKAVAEKGGEAVKAGPAPDECWPGTQQPHAVTAGSATPTASNTATHIASQ